MNCIRLKKGLDVPISGVPEQRIEHGPAVREVALLGVDYRGMKPTMVVREGDRVKSGQPVFTDKRHPEINYVAPGAGVVKAINRGAKRVFQSLVIELDGDERLEFPGLKNADLASLTSDQVRTTLLHAGLWTALRTRPFSRVPAPDSTPHSIFVQAIDTEPLAANPALIINEHPQDFVHGLHAIRHLSGGTVYLCTAPGADIPGRDLNFISHYEFDGPHPAGLPGTHIHFLDPVSSTKVVWHINYQDVIAIGKLMATGHLWTDRVISLAGPQVTSPILYRTRLGASLSELTEGKLKPGDNRIISGSVLSGRQATPPLDYLGRYHNQVSVLLEGRDREFLGWQRIGFDEFSVKRVFATGFAADGRRFPMTTNLRGSHRAIVPIGSYEDVMPLDILPTFLLRALACEDTDLAQSLGALELDEEDVALLTFVDPGKHDFGPLLRSALNRIEIEG